MQELHYNTDDDRLCALNEISILRSIPANNFIVPLLHDIDLGNKAALVFPYDNGTDMCNLIMNSMISSCDAIRYARHIAQGILHIKNYGIAHGDISPENVVVSGGVARLIDFGSAVRVANHADDEYVYRGKLGYICPEFVIHGTTAATIDPFAVDVWAFGCLLFTMFTQRFLYADPSDTAFQWLSAGRANELLDKYSQMNVTTPPNVHAMMVSIFQPIENRPSIEEIVATM